MAFSSGGAGGILNSKPGHALLDFCYNLIVKKKFCSQHVSFSLIG
jgi:hypothetical protein